MSEWVGLTELKAALEKVSAQTDLAAKVIVAKSAALVIKEAMDNFEGTRKRVKGPRGTKYWHVTPDRHTGGDKPNVISGDLRRSIKAEPITSFGLAMYGTVVGPRMIYGRRVELGLNGNGHPFFEPAVIKARLEFPNIASDTWREFLH